MYGECVWCDRVGEDLLPINEDDPDNELDLDLACPGCLTGIERCVKIANEFWALDPAIREAMDDLV